MTDKKYELTDITHIHVRGGCTLHRIKALRNFSDVRVGDLGGWVEFEHNLSHNGNAWIYNEAIVTGGSLVDGNAKVKDNSSIHGFAHIGDNATIHQNAKVCDNAEVIGDSEVGGRSLIYRLAKLAGKAKVGEDAYVQYGVCIDDISTNLIKNIEVQCNLLSINGEVYCYDQVNSDLISYHEPKTKYVVGEWVVDANPNMNPQASCVGGLTVSNATYSNYRTQPNDMYVFCRVQLDDIITVQRGSIRCTRLFVIGVCDNKVDV